MNTHIPPQSTGITATAPQGPEAEGNEVVETPAVALSIQNQMARLSMVQAHASKQAATEKLQEVQEVKEQLDEARHFLLCVDRLKSGTADYDKEAFAAYLKKHNIDLPGIQVHLVLALAGTTEDTSENVFYSMDKDKGDVLRRQIDGVKEEITSKMQSAMTMLQDFMGQYQSFVEGARTAAAKANDVALKLSR